MTTLEEIFLKLGEEEEAKKELEFQRQLQKKKKKKNKNSDGRTDSQETIFRNGNGVNHNGEGKDMSGFAFESVNTNKSTWQMYKALTYVSKNRPGSTPYKLSAIPIWSSRSAPYEGIGNRSPSSHKSSCLSSTSSPPWR